MLDSEVHRVQPDLAPRLLLGLVVQQMEAQGISKGRRFRATDVGSQKVQLCRKGRKPSKCLLEVQNQHIFLKSLTQFFKSQS